jgi:hypothetical protein
MLTDEERNHLLSIADTVASLHAVDTDYRRGHCLAAAERIRAIAAPRVATVGELLAAAPVGVAIEYQKNGRWWQLFIDTRSVVRRVWSIHGRWGNEWAADYLLGEHNRGEFMLPARIVSLADRDAPPASRGPIGEG